MNSTSFSEKAAIFLRYEIKHPCRGLGVLEAANLFVLFEVVNEDADEILCLGSMCTRKQKLTP